MIKEVILFGAPSWCMPCRLFEPRFVKVSRMDEFKDISFKIVDMDDDSEEVEELASKYNVTTIPHTVLLDENNKVIKNIKGAVSEEDFLCVLKS